jgi:hypothetical protein
MLLVESFLDIAQQRCRFPRKITKNFSLSRTITDSAVLGLLTLVR